LVPLSEFDADFGIYDIGLRVLQALRYCRLIP
jgi:hypothetical protein